MKYEIKKIDIWTCARFAGLFYGLFGLIPMVFAVVAFFTNRGGFSMQMLAVFLFPLGLFVGGFVVGIVFALVYNTIAHEVGGIKLDIEYNEDQT